MRLRCKGKTYYPHIINLKETSFEFEFGFTLDSETSKKLKISGNKFNNISIENNTDFIFYVFNEDFVRENIREKKYQIDSNIDGYIIGNAAINLDKQNENLISLNNIKVNLEKQINEAIQKTLKELLLFSIAKNTNEYKEITFEKVLAGKKYQVQKSFDEYVAEHNKLKSLPDDISLLDEIPDFTIGDFSTEIASMSQPYTLNNFSETFKQEVLSKLEFIQNGLRLSNGKVCPFCGQSYDIHASELIKIIQSFSHGEIREEQSYTDDMIIEACKALINYITLYYPGQIDRIKSI